MGERAERVEGSETRAKAVLEGIGGLIEGVEGEGPPDVVEETEAQGLIMAALLSTPGGMPTNHVHQIIGDYNAHKLMATMWELVFDGQVGVTWDGSIEETVFTLVKEPEVAYRRARIREGMGR